MDYPYVIHTHDLQTCKEGYLLILRPFRFHHPVTIICKELGGVRAVGPVNGQPLTGGNKTKYIITWYWLTAVGKIVNDLITALSENDQLCILPRNDLLVGDHILLEIMHCFYRT